MKAQSGVGALRAVHSLFKSNHNAWIKQFVAAETPPPHGYQCSPTSDRATCWCLLGGIMKVLSVMPNHPTPKRRLSAYNAAVHRMGFADSRALTEWNDADDRTIEEVLDRLERAIEAPIEMSVP